MTTEQERGGVKMTHPLFIVSIRKQHGNLFEYLSRIFFHGKVERKSTHLVIGQFQVFLCFPNRY